MQETNHQPTNFTSPRVVRLIASTLLVLTLLGAFWAGLFPIRGSNDPWWHLKTGQVLWQHFQTEGFSFPEYDVFTYTGEETPWINHEWLADLIFYAVYAFSGLQGTILFKSLLITLTIALLIFYMVRNGVSWPMACTGAIVALLASQSTLFLRPPIFTYLFIVIFLHIILCFQLNEHFKLAFFGAILAEILWINLHGGAVIGILLVFFWWLSELWFCCVTWINENPTAPSFKRLRTSTLVLICVTLASLINPFTYEVHLLPFNVMNDNWLVRNLGELQSPNMHYTNAFEAIILGLLLLPMLRAASIWVYEGLAIVFFAHQALNFLRHIPLFALVAVPPLFNALAEERQALMPIHDKNREYKSIWGRLYLAIKWLLDHQIDIILIFLLFAFTFGLRPGKIWTRNFHDFHHLVSHGYIKERYPKGAVDFIEHYKLPGPMFNDDNFAGYLIWRLSPEKRKLFTDSRFDLWGSYYAKEKIGVYQARSLPVGAYDELGNWVVEFGDEWNRKSIRQLLNMRKDLPELQAWFDSGKEYWKWVLDKYNVNFIISYERQPIDIYLRNQFRGWHLIYDDIIMYNKNGGYVIYIRDTEENLPLIRKHALIHRDHIPPE